MTVSAMEDRSGWTPQDDALTCAQHRDLIFVARVFAFHISLHLQLLHLLLSIPVLTFWSPPPFLPSCPVFP
jgi:hypothetical protein